MVTTLAPLTELRNALEAAIANEDDAEAIARLIVSLDATKAAGYRRSPREPMESLIDERDAADDALGTVFEMMVDGYVPEAGVIEDLRAQRDACQLEIDARRSLVGVR